MRSAAASRISILTHLRVEDLLDPVADQVVHRLHLEVLGETSLDVVDERELGVALTGLLEQPGVLERDAQAARERGQETYVGVAERVLAVEVLERDHAGRFAPDHERDEQGGLRWFPLKDARLTEPFGLLIEVLVGEVRLAGLEHVAPEADDLDGLVGEPDASLDRVGEADQTRRLIEHPDVDDLRVEDLLQAIADEVVHRLHLQVLGEAPLDVVDQRELGVALPGLLEQPGVLERDAEAPGERRQEPEVGVVERVLAVDVLQRDHPGGPSSDDQRHEHAGPRAARPG